VVFNQLNIFHAFLKTGMTQLERLFDISCPIIYTLYVLFQLNQSIHILFIVR